MWNLKMIMQMCTVAILMSGLLLIVYQVYQWDRAEEADRCHAAQQTILDEAELIATGGKFPGEQVTDRWKKLLVGCDAL